MLKKLKGSGKFKEIIYQYILLLITLFLLVLVLDNNYQISFYFVCLVSGMCSLLIGENNSLSILNLGLGITRLNVEKKLIKELLILTLNFIILIGFDILFVFIIYKNFTIKVSFIIFTYLLSLILCLVILFIKFNYKNKLLLLIPFGIIALTIGIMFIKNKIIVDIILFVEIIFLYFLNRYTIYNKEVE